MASFGGASGSAVAARGGAGGGRGDRPSGSTSGSSSSSSSSSGSNGGGGSGGGGDKDGDARGNDDAGFSLRPEVHADVIDMFGSHTNDQLRTSHRLPQMYERKVKFKANPVSKQSATSASKTDVKTKSKSKSKAKTKSKPKSIPVADTGVESSNSGFVAAGNRIGASEYAQQIDTVVVGAEDDRQRQPQADKGDQTESEQNNNNQGENGEEEEEEDEEEEDEEEDEEEEEEEEEDFSHYYYVDDLRNDVELVDSSQYAATFTCWGVWPIIKSMVSWFYQKLTAVAPSVWVHLATVGFVSALIAFFIEHMVDWLKQGREAASFTGFFVADWAMWILTSFICMFLAVSCCHYISFDAIGSGIPEMKAFLAGATNLIHFLSPRTLVAKITGFVFALSAGASIGKEGPFVHIAACVANALFAMPGFQSLRRNSGLQRQLLAAAVAAGVTMSFGTVISGALFSVEVTSTFFLVSNLYLSFYCAMWCMVAVYLFGEISNVALYSLDVSFGRFEFNAEIIAHALLGVICGLWATAFVFLCWKWLDIKDRGKSRKEMSKEQEAIAQQQQQQQQQQPQQQQSQQQPQQPIDVQVQQADVKSTSKETSVAASSSKEITTAGPGLGSVEAVVAPHQSGQEVMRLPNLDDDEDGDGDGDGDGEHKSASIPPASTSTSTTTTTTSASTSTTTTTTATAPATTPAEKPKDDREGAGLQRLFSRSRSMYRQARARTAIQLDSWFARAENLLGQIMQNRYLYGMGVILIIGLVSYPFAPLRIADRSVINTMFHVDPFDKLVTSTVDGYQVSVWAKSSFYFSLIFYAVWKGILTSLSLSVAIPAGVFTPVFTMGAVLGRFYGEVLAVILPTVNIVPATYAIVGAAALTSAVTRTVSPLLTVMELTGQLKQTLPVLVGMIVAHSVSAALCMSIYDMMLQIKKLPYLPSIKASQGKVAEDVMERNVSFFSSDRVTFLDIVQTLYKKNHYFAFPCVDPVNRTVIGAIFRDKLMAVVRLRENDFRMRLTPDELFELDNMVTSKIEAPGQAEPPVPQEITEVREWVSSQFSRILVPSRRIPQQQQQQQQQQHGNSGDDIKVDIANNNSEGDAVNAGVSSTPSTTAGDIGGPRLTAAGRSSASGKQSYQASQSKHPSLEERYHQFMSIPFELDKLPPSATDETPLQVSPNTPLMRVRFMFSMLGLEQILVTENGRLVGIITKESLSRH